MTEYFIFQDAYLCKCTKNFANCNILTNLPRFLAFENMSTPPNAIAHSTGFIAVRDMERFGLLTGIIGLALGYGALILFGRLLW